MRGYMGGGYPGGQLSEKGDRWPPTHPSDALVCLGARWGELLHKTPRKFCFD